ncbi:dipeptide epimerase [Algibacter amylolyticus]|uniref:Dipeptide epimerase n=1 Tax=Algibacter amylolyticus TaxID=1608400 RepID=A0A5M7BDM6_9FLAO|nr:dipeptide epimerase [Algibacter amylolyticus]KAA5827519.1 dipeptide epimerase [Algibacter amylolyticus]MBB5266720.1 L-alanine-DL-glutamate epimerase-like enolase superfamily enzyme [Algibacter amylolyticus]TSJ81764.1 dipeptide epimerase [Algibacter amylolyticus]
MEVILKPYELKLRHTFTISRESHDVQPSLIVCLSLNGKTGYGEATSNPYYNITVESMMLEINAILKDIEDFNFTTPDVFHAFLMEKGLTNFSICALDLAAHDLYGKLQNQPLYSIWGTNLDSFPTTNYTIGIASIDEMVAKMQETPWPIYKIKLGTDDDVSIVKALRKHSDAVFRIDANCAWTAEETIRNAPLLKDLGVEFLEQPLKANDWEGMKEVMKHAVLPVIADESCIVESDVEACGNHFSGINIKLTKCGGLTPALRMIKKGKAMGVKVMVGCMTESTVGISAIAQLLPQLDYVDMDGALLLKEDIAKGVSILPDAKVIFPTLGGSGITLK